MNGRTAGANSADGAWALSWSATPAAIARRGQDTGATIFIRLLTSRVVHVNEIVSAQGQAAGKPRPFEPHLMPGHGRGVEDVPLAANELTRAFKPPGDLTRLYDPPLRRSRMQMAKYRV